MVNFKPIKAAAAWRSFLAVARLSWWQLLWNMEAEFTSRWDF